LDLLLDVDVVLDLCAPRPQWFAAAANALARCMESGGRIWLYTGSVQTYEYGLRRVIEDNALSSGQDLSNAACIQLARRTLREFAQDKHWLAALAAEGDVFAAPDCEDEQLLRALDRFAPGSVKLLTRDAAMLQSHPDKAVSPQQFCGTAVQSHKVDFIDLKIQQDRIRPRLEEGVHRIFHHGQYILGPEIGELEARLAEYVGVRHCIGVSSGTDALLVAMLALGIGPGDEVITTPFTFIATGEMIALIGAIPVYVDIDARTYNIDPAKIEAAITPKTRAIIPVSLYGQCADMDAINAIAARHGLPVIEDAAQSFGATYKRRQSCGLSLIGCTSFFPSKPLGAYGDAGACFTDDDALAKVMREIRVHGQDRRYHHPRIGINGRLDSLQAAVLLAKLAIFPEEVDARSRIGARYSQLLSDAGCVTPYVAPHNTSVYAQYTIAVDDRERFIAKLTQAGIPTAVHYPVPLHRQPAFARMSLPTVPVAEQAAARVVSLPMHANLAEDELTHIARCIIDGIQ
jgi:UDP-2-acetamido-2-deoxy-ribo-hexuluronate aminotransferase